MGRWLKPSQYRQAVCIGLDARFATQLSARLRFNIYSYEAFTPLELRLMRALGMRDPPRYFHELLEFQKQKTSRQKLRTQFHI
jgi:hypothetical protein